MTIQNALPTGSIIDDYEITGVLGVGGFGITYKGYDSSLDREVAIKEYLPSSIAVRRPFDQTVSASCDSNQKHYEFGLQKFLDEARVLAKFHVPNIVGVNRFLERNGTAYLIMDYEDGEVLFQHIKRRQILTEKMLLDIFLPVLEGLKAIHMKSYLHRDIKPSNIYLAKNQVPKLIDFGAARVAWNERSRTMTQMLTPGYAPFEQYQSHGKQGPWTDLYALGATIYLVVTGKKPLESTERVAALQDGQEDPMPLASDIAFSQYHSEFLQTIDWMLKVRPVDRPQTALQVIQRFEKVKLQIESAPRMVKEASKMAQRVCQQKRVPSPRRYRIDKEQILMNSTVALLVVAGFMVLVRMVS